MSESTSTRAQKSAAAGCTASVSGVPRSACGDSFICHSALRPASGGCATALGARSCSRSRARRRGQASTRREGPLAVCGSALQQSLRLFGRATFVAWLPGALALLAPTHGGSDRDVRPRRRWATRRAACGAAPGMRTAAGARAGAWGAQPARRRACSHAGAQGWAALRVAAQRLEERRTARGGAARGRSRTPASSSGWGPREGHLFPPSFAPWWWW